MSAVPDITQGPGGEVGDEPLLLTSEQWFLSLSERERMLTTRYG